MSHVRPHPLEERDPLGAVGHGDGTGVAGIVPFFSVLLIMGAAFVATSSLLLNLGFAGENARQLRVGLSGGSVTAAQVVQAFLPGFGAMVVGALAVWPLGAYVQVLNRRAGLEEALLFHPGTLVAQTAALCAVALLRSSSCGRGRLARA